MAEPISKHCWVTPKCGISFAKKHFGNINIPNDDYKFIIVRNPYERLVSFYCQKVIRYTQGEKRIPHYCEVTKLNKDLEHYKYFEIESNISFEDFVKDLSTRNIYKMERHLKPQVVGIENILFHKVVKLEKFNEDVKDVCEELKIDYESIVKKPVENTYNKLDSINEPVFDKKTKWFLENGIPKNYELFYNKEIKDLVYKIYQTDFEIFKYEK